MTKYKVLVDIDENDGDDDVFVVKVIVEAQTPEEATARAETMAAACYGESKVLGAWDARELA